MIDKLITPKSLYWDDARHEFVLNVLLVGSIILAGGAFITKFIQFMTNAPSYEGLKPEVLLIFFIFLSFLLFLSRAGKVKLSAFLLICFLFISASYTNLKWGVESSQGLLTQVLVIVMAGILINTKLAVILTFIIVLNLSAIFYIHQAALIKPDILWKQIDPTFGKVMVYQITLILVTIITWLSNREIERALTRARKSEAALKKYNDELENVVAKRTRELQEVQVEKFLQMYRFSEFGRISSGLFHDLVNHLNLISLNLDKLNETSKNLKQEEIKKLLDRTISGTHRLENFVLTARKQMQNQEVLQVFSLKNEVAQSIELLTYKAKKGQVKIHFTHERDIKVFGNPVKFSQVITNLIVNAIDAYESVTKINKSIEINFKKDNDRVFLTVEDGGSGIPRKSLPKIFDSLFTTKSFDKGMGLGLAVSKDIIERDFKGKITVNSHEGQGTIFTISFPASKPPRGRMGINTQK